jgi:methionyl-tRNA synthetase
MKPTIQYEDFEKLDIRVGKIVTAIAPEWSNKLLQMTVDFGAEVGQKTVLSGIRKWYQPDELIGKNYAFVVNLAERKMGESVSQGMMIMADGVVDGEEHPIICAWPLEIPVGTVVR